MMWVCGSSCSWRGEDGEGEGGEWDGNGGCWG